MKTKTFIRCTFVAALVSISGAQVATAESTHPTLIAMDDMSKEGMKHESMSKDDLTKDSLKRNRLLKDFLKKCDAMKKGGTMTSDETARCDKLKQEWNDITTKTIKLEKDELKSDGMKKP